MINYKYYNVNYAWKPEISVETKQIQYKQVYLSFSVGSQVTNHNFKIRLNLKKTFDKVLLVFIMGHDYLLQNVRK